MLLLDAIGPTVALGVIAAAHVFYHTRHARRVTQHVIDVIDFHSAGRETSASIRPAVDAFGVGKPFSQNNPAPTGRRAIFEQAPQRIAAGLAERVFAADDVRLSGGDFIDIPICMGDLIIDGQCTFFSAVKVNGDLIVNGQARFMGPVVVNGHVKVRGAACFEFGLVAKQQIAVSGYVEVGTKELETWVVARVINSVGEVHLSGQVNAIQSEPLEHAA